MTKIQKVVSIGMSKYSCYERFKVLNLKFNVGKHCLKVIEISDLYFVSAPKSVIKYRILNFNENQQCQYIK